MAKEKTKTEHKKRNKFSASLAVVIVMFFVSILELFLYFRFDEDSNGFVMTASASFALGVVFFIWFICIAAKHKKFHGVTVAIVGILAFSWLISSLPLFSAIMSSYASNGTSLHDFSFSFIWFDLGFYMSGDLIDVVFPYINFVVSVILLLIVPGLFSNERIAIREMENPETEGVVSSDGKLKKVDHSKNRFRMALALSIIVTISSILGTILIMTSRSNMLAEIFIEIFLAIFLVIILIILVPINKRIARSAFVFTPIFIVMLLFTSVCVAVLYSSDISHDEYNISVDMTFFVGAIKAVYSGVPMDGGEIVVSERLVPYIDLVVSVVSLIITSILFGRDRKKILNLKKENPLPVEK
ncbi:MAG: hypothetical protein LUB56_02900 [Coprobacillus sp.]|nr:hypothetical protein [Coprobacillus sp.]